MTDLRLTILDRNACRNCPRPITLIENVGWLHDELLPQCAYEEITCEQAIPVAPRCPECGGLTAAVVTSSGLMLLSHSSGSSQCSGGGVTVCPPSSTI